MDWDRIFEKIEFEVNVNMIEERVDHFAKYIKENDTEDTINTDCTRIAFWVLNKSSEQDEEVPATLGTRRPANRAERRKATAHAKNRRKDLAKYADDEIRTNSGKVISTGWRSYEKGDKLYTRKGRAARDKFAEEPFDPWYDPDYLEDVDYETGLNLPVGTGYWSDETISEAINNHNDPYYDYDWEEILKDDEDFCLDVDGGNFYTHETAMVENLQNHCKELEEEVKKLYSFINEYNLNKLLSQWEQNNNR